MREQKPSLRQRIGRWIAGALAPAKGRHALPGVSARMYGAARAMPYGSAFGASNVSADTELHSSLGRMRSRSRQLVRDAGYGQRARAIIVNNVIGTGVGLQAQVMTTRDALATAVNDGIEAAWAEWCQAGNCHTGGVLHFADLERAAMGEVFEAGEVLLRLHYRAFGASRVPLALELIEAERLAGEHAVVAAQSSRHEVRMGVEVDQFQRPVAYWLHPRHAGDFSLRQAPTPEVLERVPADQILHIKLTSRWPQTRGVPWMHAVLRKLDDLNEYAQHEVTAAKASAAYFATIETPEEDHPLATGETPEGAPAMDIDPLMIQQLAPGEKLAFHSPNRPNSAFDAFVRSVLREVAAGAGTSYESLSRDYSQSNYSSSRLALIDDRDGYRALQQWWVRSVRMPLHRRWLQQAVLAGAVPAVPLTAYGADPQRYEAALFKCRGWSWIDPTKEVAAYKEAIRAGFTSISDVIAATAGGLDLEDVIAARAREMRMLREAGVPVDVDAPANAPGAAAAPADGDAGLAPGSPGNDADSNDEDAPPAKARVHPLPRRTA